MISNELTTYLMDRENFISAPISTAFLVSKVSCRENTSPSKGLALSVSVKNNLLGKYKYLTNLHPKPWNAETPIHLLADHITPANRLFVLNNGIVPEEIGVENCTLTIVGETAKSKKKGPLKVLNSTFKQSTCQVILDYGGYGRKEFSPPGKDNQWVLGASEVLSLDWLEKKYSPNAQERKAPLKIIDGYEL
jgi:hypothetical protein